MSTPNYSLFTPNFLITGGCGFIGTSLIKNLIKEGGHTIRVLDNLSVGTREDLARVCKVREKQKVKSKESEKASSLLTTDSSLKNSSSLLTPNSSLVDNSSLVHLIVGDICDYSVCFNCCQDIDVIVHLAASTGVGPSVEDPKKDMESNVIGTFNMLEAARNNSVKRFIFASSGAPVGECDPPIHEELAPHPVSPYGASKLAGEGYCSSYFRTFGIETIALRFGNVYGPGSNRKNSVVAKFIKQAMQGETLEIYGDGNQTRDFIYIDDLISAILKSVYAPSVQSLSLPREINDNEKQSGFHRGPQSSSQFSSQSLDLSPQSSLRSEVSSLPFGEVFQIATNHESTINELVGKLFPILATYGYDNIKVRHTSPRPGDVKRNFSDTTKARKLLNWQNEINLETGLKKTVDWFLNQQ